MDQIQTPKTIHSKGTTQLNRKLNDCDQNAYNYVSTKRVQGTSKLPAITTLMKKVLTSLLQTV